MADDAELPYAVGYGRPPTASRFRRGQSGNPRGRTRGLKPVASQISDVLNQKLQVTRGGRQVRLTLQEVMFNAIAARAAKGDLRSAAFLLAMQDRYRDSATTTLDPAELGDDDRAIIDAFFRSREGADATAEPDPVDDAIPAIASAPDFEPMAEPAPPPRGPHVERSEPARSSIPMSVTMPIPLPAPLPGALSAPRTPYAILPIGTLAGTTPGEGEQ